jgi:gamma-glutamylcyclotransferase (GGCT)/AIG2-like uncharacterized protein YtfP
MKNMYMAAYGMNTNIESMRARVPGATYIGKAKLPHHKLVFKYHADIEAADTDMEVVLWQIGPAELQELDYTEGYPVYYDRKLVSVLHAGQERQAWIYYMVQGDYRAEPSQHYLDLITAGYQNAGIPLSQLKVSISPGKERIVDNDFAIAS